MTSFISVLSAVIGYFLGSVSTSILVARISKNIDIRDFGSGNAGATNTLRVLGKKAAAVVVIGDALKGVLAILIAMALCAVFDVQSSIPLYAAGLFAVIGHNFPVYFGFKGGKGVLTSIVTVIMLDPIIGLIVLVFAVAVMAVTRYVSLGSCLGAILLFILASALRYSNTYFMILCQILSVLVIIKHKSNIKKLINGTESKLGSKAQK